MYSSPIETLTPGEWGEEGVVGPDPDPDQDQDPDQDPYQDQDPDLFISLWK